MMKVERQATRVLRETAWKEKLKRGINQLFRESQGPRLVGILLLLSGLVLTSVTVSTAARIAWYPAGEPPLPQGIPDTVLSLPFIRNYHTLSARDEHARFLGVCGQNVTLDVKFNETSSLDGHWYGLWPTLTLSPSKKTFFGFLVLVAETRNDSWGDSINSTSPLNSPIRPWLKLNLSIGAENYHGWTEAHASMKLVYPHSLVVAPFFQDTEEDMERNFSFFVVSADERLMLEKHDEWETVESQKREMWALGLASAIAVSGGALLIYFGSKSERLLPNKD
jgi:hypothetical protein